MIRFTLTCLICIALVGCASLSSAISNGNFTYAAQDVSINHFGVNYSINLPLKAGEEQVTAQTLASDCEAGRGTLKILPAQPAEAVVYPVNTAGTSSPDRIFKHLCDKNPKLVRIVRGCS